MRLSLNNFPRTTKLIFVVKFGFKGQSSSPVHRLHTPLIKLVLQELEEQSAYTLPSEDTDFLVHICTIKSELPETRLPYHPIQLLARF